MSFACVRMHHTMTSHLWGRARGMTVAERVDAITTEIHYMDGGDRRGSHDPEAWSSKKPQNVLPN